MRTNYKAGDRIECDMVFVSQTVADMPDGYIAGIASTPSTDLYGHRVLAGAFDESIKAKGLTGPRGIKLLAGHDWQKIAGTIKKLETVDDRLNIEAQLNLNVSYVRDLYEVTKGNGGLNFSVGFQLKDFEFIDDDKIENESDPWLIVKRGDLMEVSVVTFPAQLEAEMTFVKNVLPATVSEFEKALVAEGLCRSRNDAHRVTLAVKRSSHLFDGIVTPSAVTPETRHPLLDASRLAPVAELIAKAKAALTAPAKP